MASESSDDDLPLARANGRLSHPRISNSEDLALDKSLGDAKAVDVGLSIRNGPVHTKILSPDGSNGKRKSRSGLPAPHYKDESDFSDVAPLSKRQKSKHSAAARKVVDILPPSYDETALPDSSSDDDKPLGTKLAKRKAEIEKNAVKDARAIRAAGASKANKTKVVKQDSDDDDAPLVKPGSRKRQSNGTSVAKKRKLNDIKPSPGASKVVPLEKKRAATSTKSAKAAPAKKGKAVLIKQPNRDGSASGEDEDEEKEYEWWNEPKKEDDSIKWTTLEHNGVIFPPPYKQLPSHVKLLYDGVPVDLELEAEEVACFFGSMLNSKHNVENPTFQKNFFGDFRQVLKETGGAKTPQGVSVEIDEFARLDFSKIFEHFDALSAAKRSRPNAEKKAEKEEKAAAEAPYMYCKWDGRKEKVGNFRVEPPGLFRGRGEHPKTGKVKLRVLPEQVTINLGKDSPVPPPPPGHEWKTVSHDSSATWLAMWQENVNGNYKYVMLSATSAVKGQSDYKKFEKARELKKHIDRVRRDYTRDLKSQVMADRQRATAVYLIDKLALRAGNEKDTENEAETIGCCSLKFEHVTLQPPNTVIFDFLGKDSVRYHDEVAVDLQVFKNLKLFKKPPKSRGDDIFDRLNTSQLNKHLSNYMPGLTAKVFRTYNASYTMSEELKKLKNNGKLTVIEKVSLYNDCNRKVAILCNHKRTVGESHDVSMKKLEDKWMGLKYQKWRLKQMMLDVEPKEKKRREAGFFDLDSDITQDWILEHQASLVDALRQQIIKKFQKENQKLAEEQAKQMPDKELKERLQVADELEGKFKNENKTKKVQAEGRAPSVEKIETAITKCEARTKEALTNMTMKDSNKEISLGTSKINYIDPRLTVVFAKKFDVPLERFFSKALREKFNWAIKSVEDDSWEF